MNRIDTVITRSATRMKRPKADRGGFLIGVLLAAALTLAGCSSKTEVAANKAAEASALFDAGDLAGAHAAALASVRARDDIATSWILLGRINLASTNPGDAYTAFSRALELDAANVEALQTLAEIALQAGRTKEAFRNADQLLALQPDLSAAKLIKGFVALQRHRHDEANRLADEILAASPTNDGGIVLKARVIAREGDLAGADRILSDRAAANPSELILATLAEVRRKSGDGKGLADALAQLVRLAPTNDRVFDLASVQYKRGLADAGRDAILDRLIARPADAALYDRATDFWLENDPGIFDGPRLRTIDADAPLALRELAARMLLARGRAAQAREILRPVIGAGTSSDSWALYATALDALGAPADARNLVAKVLESDETNADALLFRAKAELARGAAAQALRDAQLVLRDDPNALPARLLVIGIYRQRGDPVRVRQLFAQAIVDMPRNVRLARAYVGFLESVGDHASALDVAEAYTYINPARLAGWDLLSSICRDPACARKAAAGRRIALTAFTPDDRVQLGAAGLFGRI